MNRIFSWFYGTYLGGLYFSLLLWIDRKKSRPSKYLTPKEMAQVVRQYSLLNEGVNQVKGKVNKLINSRSKEEYHLTLSEIEDMINLAERDTDSIEAKFSKALREVYIKKSSQDVVTHTDMAKMIDQRIEDHREMWDHQQKRQLMRDIRKAEKQGDQELIKKLKTEFEIKYGRSNTRPQ